MQHLGLDVLSQPPSGPFGIRHLSYYGLAARIESYHVTKAISSAPT